MIVDSKTDELRAADLMSRRFVSAAPEDTPVTEEDRPVGVAGLCSVVGALRRGFPGW